MKRGRKQKHYIGPDGNPVVGLTRQPDGRWRLIGTQTRFTEPDETRAVERFRLLTGQETGAQRRMTTNPNPFFDERNTWDWVAEQIRNRPQYVAQQTGIEQLAYLDRLTPPAKLPTFAEIEKLWTEKASCSRAQKTKVTRAWTDFKTTTKISGLRDITDAVAIAYADDVHARKFSPKEQSHLFANARRMLSFAKERRLAPAEINRALESMRLMKANDSATSSDPKPITRADWQKLLDNAKGQERAMILLMLNGAYYAGEVVELKWSDIKNDCLVAHRKKTGRCIRVSVLWPETLAALNDIPRTGEHIFTTYQKAPLRPGGAHDRFRALRERAGLQHVTSSQLRDGAFTYAAQANISTINLNILVGHSSGMADRYIKRNPQMVSDACQAVWNVYMAPQQQETKVA